MVFELDETALEEIDFQSTALLKTQKLEWTITCNDRPFGCPVIFLHTPTRIQSATLFKVISTRLDTTIPIFKCKRHI